MQVVDAERLWNSLTPEHSIHVNGQPPRISWWRNARLFAFEKKGYLPVVDVLKAITDDEGSGYKGWISPGLSSRTMADPRPNCPREHTRGRESWENLVAIMGWKGIVNMGGGSKAHGNESVLNGRL